MIWHDLVGPIAVVEMYLLKVKGLDLGHVSACGTGFFATIDKLSANMPEIF